MSTTDIIALIVTIVGVASFSAVVTILFYNYIRSAIKEVRNGERDVELVDLMVYESDQKVVRKQKASSIIKNVVYYTFLAILIPIFGLSLYSRIKNNVTQFGDNIVLVVASGSMSFKHDNNDYLITNNLNNQFNTYDLVALSVVHDDTPLRRYDIIAYRNDKGVNVIHRIIDFNTSGSELRYITRGDANPSSDTYQPRRVDILGKYKERRIPGIGIFVMFFQSYAGMMTVVAVIYCMLMTSFLRKKLDNATYDRQDMLETVFDISKLGLDDTDLMTTNHENTLFFKNTAYVFDDKQLLAKRRMTKIEKKIHEDKLKEEELKEQKKKNQDNQDKDKE